MKHRVILSPGAKADFNSALRWYLRIDPKVAFLFTQDTLRTLRRIGQYPKSYRLINGSTRRASLRRFPYFIYFSLETGFVSVISIVHQRRADIVTLYGDNGNGGMGEP